VFLEKGVRNTRFFLNEQFTRKNKRSRGGMADGTESMRSVERFHPVLHAGSEYLYCMWEKIVVSILFPGNHMVNRAKQNRKSLAEGDVFQVD
jgi:hypothetical protein